MPRIYPSPQERFWSKVDLNGPPNDIDGTRCWLWVGFITQPSKTSPGGYGQFNYDGKVSYAHRFSYELANDLKIPRGLVIDHRISCPKSCVNPNHLRLVTQKQNSEHRGASSNNLSCGIRGVTWDRDLCKWRVQVKTLGRRYDGGSYTELSDAENAAIALRNKLFTHNDLDRLRDAGHAATP